MPHAHAMPSPGFQALILCGPGISLNTFTSSPDEFPKALVPVANRAMVWYPLDWCYRMGITSIHLITPGSSAPALERALSTDPHLTSLPLPSPDILAPKDLSQNTGTAEILRLPEVQAVIKGDFVILPCDLICELGGESLAESWMIREAGLGGETGPQMKFGQLTNGLGGETIGRRGGLGVWYQTKGDEAVKGEETDFIALLPPEPPIVTPPRNSLLPHVHQLAYSIPTDTLNDITDEKKAFPVRCSLLRRHGHVKMRASYRNAHIYFFPHWVMEFVKRNPKFDSISEDVVGWWSKATWQRGLDAKLGLPEVLGTAEDRNIAQPTGGQTVLQNESINLSSMTSTGLQAGNPGALNGGSKMSVASRPHSQEGSMNWSTPSKQERAVPPILAYVHNPGSSGPMIRRVDTGPLLLSVSLRLAKVEALEDASTTGQTMTSAFAHKKKIASPGDVAGRSTVTKADCLLDENVTVEEKSVIKECVIGANCQIEKGARLTRCLLMEGVVVGERCQLNGCILGKRSKIGREAVLRDCEVQGGYQVPERADAKNEKFMVFEGLDDVGMEEEGSSADDTPGAAMDMRNS
ncbi:MAG: hypothetical protein M1823_001081 [Watsoniomyces obsoletus]|nr:MAG: hypothetical protein M1823_001081 [Watsoniomyces obsoletus]